MLGDAEIAAADVLIRYGATPRAAALVAADIAAAVTPHVEPKLAAQLEDARASLAVLEAEHLRLVCAAYELLNASSAQRESHRRTLRRHLTFLERAQESA